MRLIAYSFVLVVSVAGALVTSAGAQQSQFYVLDGFGGVHAGGGAPAISPPPPYFGFDIARDLAYMPTGRVSFTDGVLVLDALGGVHTGGALVANPPVGPTPYFGFDAARAIVRRNPSVILSASVSASGFLSSSRGAVSATKIATGKYEVTFSQSVSQCHKVATLGNEINVTLNPVTYAGYAGETATFNSTTPNSVAVVTRTSAGALADRPFHLMLHC